MNILDRIVADKNKEINERKAALTISYLESRESFARECLSMKKALMTSPSGIIAEFKRKSPSKGWIHAEADATAITSAYCANGATGISILTDHPHFGGKPADLIHARPHLNCPVLRKDFIVDEYQLFEAKSYGADVVLLIAAALTTANCLNLARRAKELGLEVLLEIHQEEELEQINEYVDIVGVNNRNLKTFEVSIDSSLALFEKLPADRVKISESGISSVEAVRCLRQAGYRGFLMGENFMKEEHPAEALRQFIASL